MQKKWYNKIAKQNRICFIRAFFRERACFAFAIHAMNLKKCKFPRMDENGSIDTIRFCLATIGVCVFCAMASAVALFVFLELAETPRWLSSSLFLGGSLIRLAIYAFFIWRYCYEHFEKSIVNPRIDPHARFCLYCM